MDARACGGRGTCISFAIGIRSISNGRGRDASWGIIGGWGAMERQVEKTDGNDLLRKRMPEGEHGRARDVVKLRVAGDTLGMEAVGGSSRLYLGGEVSMLSTTTYHK